MDLDAPTPCSSCGKTLPRGEMFGLEPLLQCPNCADDIRVRTHVRRRPRVTLGKPVVTIGIVVICVAMFVMRHMVLPGLGDFASLKLLFNLHLQNGPQIWDGEPWSLFATAFMHGGYIHIIFNMWWCWELGRAIEYGFGRLTLVLLVLGCAAFAGGLQWMMQGPSVGFSGCVYGLAMFLYVHRRTNPAAAMIMNQRTFNFLAVWFVLCIVLTESGKWNVANWGHGGGALWGYLAGMATLHARRKILVPFLVAGTLAFIVATTQIAFGVQAKSRAHYLKMRPHTLKNGPYGPSNEYWRYRYDVPPDVDEG